MLKKLINKIKDFFKNLPGRIAGWFKNLPGRIARWWKGEVKDFKRKMVGFPAEFKAWAKSKIGTGIVLLILGAFLLAGYFGLKRARENAITFEDNYEAPEATANLLGAGEYKSIAKNDKLELFFNETRGSIQIKNLEDGHIWSSIVDDSVIDMKLIKNKDMINRVQSAITVSYMDLKKRDSLPQDLRAKDCGSLEFTYIDNGVSVTYGFLKRGIFVTVEYVLDGENLVVRVPWEKVEEKSKYAVSAINVLPYFGACDNSNDGYLFYPDGSGAITCFDRVEKRNSSPAVAFYYTYSDRFVEMEKFFTESMDRYVATMPVYGIKNGDDAILVYMTEGLADASVRVYPYGVSNIPVNHINFEIYMRNIVNVTLGSSASTGQTLQRVDKHLIQEDKEIRYAFLTGDEANYSGMASEYRDYLIKNDMLKDSIRNNDEYPVALRMLMGTTKAGVAFDEYISMTTFSQAREMLEEISAMGVTAQKLLLTEWCKDSSDYNHWAPDYRLGGKSGLKELGEYADGKLNTEVFLEHSTGLVTGDTKGIKEVKDVVYDLLHNEVSINFYKQGNVYLLNPGVILERNADLLKKLKKYDGINLAYDDIGVFAYADYNENNPYTKTETVEELRNVLAQTADADRKIAVSGSNQYVFSYADYLYLLSENAYGLAITDFSVPFVQMVVSGCIPYSSRGAGNLAYDLDIQKLKWIEYGAIPYFYVTYDSALNLRDTDNDTVFSSTWDDWKTVIADTYKEFKDNFACVYGVQMTEHEVITEKISKIVYANGVTVYVNYDEKAANADGLTIPAKGYVVTGGYSK